LRHLLTDLRSLLRRRHGACEQIDELILSELRITAGGNQKRLQRTAGRIEKLD
jgi:hypothetical protein